MQRQSRRSSLITAGFGGCVVGSDVPIGESRSCLCVPCDPMSRKWAVEGKWCSLRSPLSQARSTHSIQFVGVSNPLENGVALKVVEEFEVVVARNAKDLERRAVSECSSAEPQNPSRLGKEGSSTYLLDAGLLEAFDNVLREFDIAAHDCFAFWLCQGAGCEVVVPTAMTEVLRSLYTLVACIAVR